MKITDRLEFVYRFLNIAQKKNLKKVADTRNTSMNQEINIAIDTHIKEFNKDAKQHNSNKS